MSKNASRIVFVSMAVFFACFFVLPIWSTVKSAFEAPTGGFTFEYVTEVFLNPLYREGLMNSFAIAFWTTLGCLLVALPLAFCYVRFEFPGKVILNSLVLVPMILPPFVGAIGAKRAR